VRGKRSADASARSVPDFLAEMVAAARQRVAEAHAQASLDAPGHLAPSVATSSRALGRLHETLTRARAAGRLGVIAEAKRRSPSRGDIAPGLDAAEQAGAYETAGADAVSVLTEPTRFGGTLEDLADVAAAVDLPVLRKDFIVDACQVREAAAAGAAAVLLIVAALDDATLGRLLRECAACGLDALVEAHDAEEVLRALAAGASIVGINNRDLRSLEVDLAVTEQLASLVPPDGVLLVSESGIATSADARRVAEAGAHAVLVGEALMRCAPERLADLIAGLRAPGRPS
jgi:indole-3-glycerol phosphate synthase